MQKYHLSRKSTNSASTRKEKCKNLLTAIVKGIAKSLLSFLVSFGKSWKNALGTQLTLMKGLFKSANFSEKDAKKLQVFSDACCEIDSQLEFLPGLACMNYPSTMTIYTRGTTAVFTFKVGKDGC